MPTKTNKSKSASGAASKAKTTTTGTTSSSNLPHNEEKVVNVVEPVIKEVTPAVVEKKKFAVDESILCRSITSGGLYMEGPKSGLLYSWVDYGDECDVEYRDLVALVRGKSQFVFAPLFIIDDEDFINEFSQLKQFYDDSYTVKDLEGVLDLPCDSMIATIKTLPKGAIASLKTIASTQVSNGRLDSMKKIKALDDIFGTELNLIASMI